MVWFPFIKRFLLHISNMGLTNLSHIIVRFWKTDDIFSNFIITWSGEESREWNWQHDWNLFYNVLITFFIYYSFPSKPVEILPMYMENGFFSTNLAPILNGKADFKRILLPLPLLFTLSRGIKQKHFAWSCQFL